MIEFCMCGHPKERHFEGPIVARCSWCLLAKESAWHEFKLDNLKYIEALAKEKNLI